MNAETVMAPAPADLAPLLARLGGALRQHGVGTTLRDEIDAALALPLVDLGDRAEVALTLRIALKIPRPDWAAFARLFARLWTARLEGEASGETAAPPPVRPPADGTRRPPGRLLAWDPDARRMLGGGPHAVAADGRVEESDDDSDDPSDGRRAAWTPAALLRRKAFDDGAWSASELARMRRLLERLARRLAAHPSRRWVRAPSAGARRGRVDLRRSSRRALATAGEMVRLARRVRAVDRPGLVFICDTSGSMDAHARFLLAFVLSLRRAARQAELFAFNTELVHLTPALARGGDVRRVLDRLPELVPDWSGGTRIGASLAAFADRHLAALVDGKTTVVVLSDGLDRGEPELLVAALRRITARARRLVWLNPLAGQPAYEPEARGMQAALPFIDDFASARDLASLERALLRLVH